MESWKSHVMIVGKVGTVTAMFSAVAASNRIIRRIDRLELTIDSRVPLAYAERVRIVMLLWSSLGDYAIRIYQVMER